MKIASTVLTGARCETQFGCAPPFDPPPKEDRPLSIKEYKRIQGIPDDYQLVGSVNDKYKFIGNGVPVEMATAIAESISKYYSTELSTQESFLVKEKSTEKKILTISVDNTDTEDIFEPIQMSLFG